MLQSRIKPVPNDPATSNDGVGDISDEDFDDVFTSFLPHLFPDEAHSCLGDPGKTLLYESPRYGGLRVVVPGDGNGSGSGDADADKDEGRRLFAHYLWGGALVVADGVEGADSDSHKSGKRGRGKWDVRGQRVLEVGAGAALPSLIAALAGAETVAITDHPSSSALYGPIQTTINSNIKSDEARARISIQAHEWGVLPFPSQENNGNGGGGDGRAGQRDRTADLEFAATNKGAFTRIVCADCLWMSDQHDKLVQSLLWFLAPFSSVSNPGGGGREEEEEEGKGKEKGGRVWVSAGFHTGRHVVASFFDKVVKAGFVVEDIWERDMNASEESGGEEVGGVCEVTREWCPVREGEGPENRARWCVVALLRRA